MRYSDCLYPGRIRNQMTAAINGTREKMEAVSGAITRMDNIAGAKSDSTLAIKSVKLLATDLAYVSRSLLLAYQNDLIKYNNLSGAVGDEDLVGSRIIQGQREALKEEARCISSADRYRDIPYEDFWVDQKGNEHWYTDYYTDWGMVDCYMMLAANARDLYDEWVRKEERYDEIEASTCGIFAGSAEAYRAVEDAFRNIDGCIVEGGYCPDGSAAWRVSLPAQNEALSAEVNAWYDEQERLAAKARKEEGIWTVVKGVGLIVLGAACIVCTYGAATPIVAAGIAAGGGTMLFGAFDTAEGAQDIYYGSVGDIDTKSWNGLKDGVFMGNEELYNQVEEGFAFAASALIPIGTASAGIKMGSMTAKEGVKYVGNAFLQDALSGAAGGITSKVTMDLTGNRTISMLAGMGVSFGSSCAMNNLGPAKEIRADIKTNGATKPKLDEITNTPKGSRPDPTDYLYKEYMDAHLKQFDNGISVIQTKNAYTRYTEANGFVGVPADNSLFVMPKDYCDDVIVRANGNVSIIERELGFPDGYFSKGGGLVRIDAPSNPDLNIRIPSGNEAGANSLWISGGKTAGGVSEAITNIIPLKDVNITNIIVK